MKKKEIIKSINYYQEGIIKYRKRENQAKTLHCLQKLDKLPIETQHLEETKIGLTVNSLCQVVGEIGDVSNSLVIKWKKIVCENIDKEEELKQRSDGKRRDYSKSSSNSEKPIIKRKYSDTEENQRSIKKVHTSVITDIPVEVTSANQDLKPSPTKFKQLPLGAYTIPKSDLTKPLPKINVPDKEIPLEQMFTKKRQATKIFSGCKTTLPKLSSLYQMCVENVKKHLNTLVYTRGATFDALKPVLEFASSNQLLKLEDYNPYLMENTNEIWKTHCERQFSNKKREDMETWRDLYLRSVDEREFKLKSVASNIRLSRDKHTNQRQIEFINTGTPVKSRSKILSNPGNTTNKKSLTKFVPMADSKTKKGAKPSPNPKKGRLMLKTLALMKKFR